MIFKESAGRIDATCRKCGRLRFDRKREADNRQHGRPIRTGCLQSFHHPRVFTVQPYVGHEPDSISSLRLRRRSRRSGLLFLGSGIRSQIEHRLRYDSTLVDPCRADSHILHRHDAGQLADAIEEYRCRMVSARHFHVDGIRMNSLDGSSACVPGFQLHIKGPTEPQIRDFA